MVTTKNKWNGILVLYRCLDWCATFAAQYVEKAAFRISRRLEMPYE